MKKISDKVKKILSGRKVFVSACALSAVIISGSVISYAATANGYDFEQAKANNGWTSTVTGNHYNSYGKINYTDGTNTVVADAADIAAIDSMVGEGKTAIKDAIKNVDTDDRLGTSAWTDTTYPDFANLANLISSSQTLADDKKGTQAVNSKGESLYYKDQAASDAHNLTQTCTDNTGLPVYYQEATAANLTAGSAAFINGELILGTGADNDTYFDQGYAEGMAYATNNTEISYTYHKHVDNDGNEQNSSYQANGRGGCFTTENIVYTTTTGTCGGWIGYSHTSQIYDDVANKWVNWKFYRCTRCGQEYAEDHVPPSSSCTKTVNKRVDSGKRYYTVGCGKTESSIESATITFK